jgi:hypothetical protein
MQQFVKPGLSIYDIQNVDQPHLDIGIRYSDGSVVLKAMANDSNDKERHEQHVIDLFMQAYIHLRFGNDRPLYRVVGRDNDGKQIHDFTIKIPELPESLPIEITKLSDDNEVHLSHALRDDALRIAKKFNGHFFAFLPPTTKRRELLKLFSNALALDSIDAPDPQNDRDLMILIDQLKIPNKPFVRLLTHGATQIHTYGSRRLSLREMTQTAIAAKESKDYSPFNQKNMILVLDDKSMYYSREYIDNTLPLLSYYFAGSTFKEIWIISRKTSPGGTGKRRKRSKHEMMLSPIKTSWHYPTYLNKLLVISKLNNGETLPLSF